MHPLVKYHAGRPKTSKIRLQYFGGYYWTRFQDGTLQRPILFAWRPTDTSTPHNLHMTLLQK